MNHQKYLVLPGNYSHQVANQLAKYPNFIQIKEEEVRDYSDIQYIWKPTNFQFKIYEQIKSNDESYRKTIINHFDGINHLTSKNGLIQSLKAYYQQIKSKQNKIGIWDVTPISYIVDTELDSPNFRHFEKVFKQIKKGNKQKCYLPWKHCDQNLWIVKPVNLNQGRGIEIFSNIQEIKIFLSQRPLSSQWILQKYLERPLLYKKRKFDIRVWAIVNQNFDIYMFKNGYLRTSSENYTTDKQSQNIHLTNNCLQNKLDTYGQHEEGNTLSFQDFQNYLDENYNGVSLEEHILPSMKDFIIDSIQSCKDKLNNIKLSNCFELLGYDFMIDEDFRLWLIEVNTNPYLGAQSAQQKQILSKMIEDMIELTTLPLFPNKTLEKSEYELIHSQEQSGRRSFDKNILYPFEKPNDFYEEQTIENKLIKTDPELKEKPQIKNTIFDIYNSLKQVLESYPYTDHTPFYNYLQKIFNKLKNANNMNQNDCKYLSQCLRLINQSRLIEIFYEEKQQEYLQLMNKMFIDEQVNILIRKQIFFIFSSIMKIHSPNKIIVKNTNIFQNILQLSILQEVNQELQQEIINYIFNICDVFERKKLVPGYSREYNQFRNLFIMQGGILILFILQTNENNKFNNILKVLNYEEWDIVNKQIQNLEQLKLKYNQFEIIEKLLDIEKFSILMEDYIKQFKDQDKKIKKENQKDILNEEKNKQNKKYFDEYHIPQLLQIKYLDEQKIQQLNEDQDVNLSQTEQIKKKKQFLNEAIFKEWEKNKIKQQIEKINEQKQQNLELEKQKIKMNEERSQRLMSLLQKQKQNRDKSLKREKFILKSIQQKYDKKKTLKDNSQQTRNYNDVYDDNDNNLGKQKLPSLRRNTSLDQIETQQPIQKKQYNPYKVKLVDIKKKKKNKEILDQDIPINIQENQKLI